MADYPKDSFIQLFKRFRNFLSVKISNDSRSVGAFAGLAFAVVFAWTLLRSPSGGQRRRPKPQTGGPSTSSASSDDRNSVATPTTAASITLPVGSTAQFISENLSQPLTPILGKIVRNRLGEARKVTCRLLGVILKETSPEELQNQVTVRSSVREVLLEITKHYDLYLMERVLDDETEKKVLLALEDAEVFTSGGFVKDKVLFCSTEIGRTSFVRQLEPDWHVDTNLEIVSQLARFIKNQLYISPSNTDKVPSNVYSSTSLEQFFGCA
ncbi:unnamed protein product [Cuscuta epithymum]|uniref:Peroxisome biogenesis protein 22 n=1 Tax=Cuscuta epithymum TaxID=186058 RepID=A0AAV0CD61_9ASTE|nr:unnamed protein product [Cuscuta epithymum]